GPPGIRPNSEGDEAGVSHARPREVQGPPAPLRSRLALAGGDRKGLPRPGAQAPSRRRWRSPRVPEGPVGDRGASPLSAAGFMITVRNVYRDAGAWIPTEGPAM